MAIKNSDINSLQQSVQAMGFVSQVDLQLQLAGLQQSIDRLTASVTNLTNVVDTGFADINTRFDVTDHNVTSRQLNGHIRSRDTPLYTIVNSQGQPIPNLPQSIEALEEIEENSALITSFLQQMGVANDDIPHAVKEQYNLLKRKMGLPTIF